MLIWTVHLCIFFETHNPKSPIFPFNVYYTTSLHLLARCHHSTCTKCSQCTKTVPTRWMHFLVDFSSFHQFILKMLSYRCCPTDLDRCCSVNVTAGVTWEVLVLMTPSCEGDLLDLHVSAVWDDMLEGRGCATELVGGQRLAIKVQLDHCVGTARRWSSETAQWSKCSWYQ